MKLPAALRDELAKYKIPDERRQLVERSALARWPVAFAASAANPWKVAP